MQKKQCLEAAPRAQKSGDMHTQKPVIPLRMLRMSRMEMKKPRSMTILRMEKDIFM
jgi:hypothetical protein